MVYVQMIQVWSRWVIGFISFIRILLHRDDSWGVSEGSKHATEDLKHPIVALDCFVCVE